MKTIALFNNKGGVGKTTLAYHLGFMFAELGRRVLFADLDPQANLSTMCIADDRLEEIWKLQPRPTVYGAVDRLRRGLGDIEMLSPESVGSRISIVPGDLQLCELEDLLSEQWPKCLDREERAFRVTTSLHRLVADVGKRTGAHLAVLDVGPTFGAINRAALIAADYVIVPVAPDLFSMQGLENVGPRLSAWRVSGLIVVIARHRWSSHCRQAGWRPSDTSSRGTRRWRAAQSRRSNDGSIGCRRPTGGRLACHLGPTISMSMRTIIVSPS